MSNFTSTARPTYSAWGAVSHATECAPGIWFVSTTSHGGFVLSDERLGAMPAALRCNTYAGTHSFEEDCEASLVVAAFPEYFSVDQVTQARASIVGMTRNNIKGYETAGHYISQN